MNALDIVLAVFLGLSVFYGLWRGFVHIALGVAGFGVGLALALRFAERGPAWFGGVFASPAVARAAAFAAVFVTALAVTALVIFFGGRLIRAAGIGWMDRMAGGVVGLAGGMLAIIGMLLGLTTFLPPGSAMLRRSRIVPVVLNGIDLASAVLPPEMADAYHERREALARRVEPPPPAPRKKAS
jgi:membrane protein required for colicin V production